MSAQKQPDVPTSRETIGHVPQALSSKSNVLVNNFIPIEEGLPADPKLKCLMLREKTKKIQADCQAALNAQKTRFQNFAERLPARDCDSEAALIEARKHLEPALNEAKQTILDLKKNEEKWLENVRGLQCMATRLQILTDIWACWREVIAESKLILQFERLTDTLERCRNLQTQLQSERWLRVTIGLIDDQRETNQYVVQKDSFLESIDFEKIWREAWSQVSLAQPARPYSFLAEHFAALSDKCESDERNRPTGKATLKVTPAFPEGLGPFALLESQQFGGDIKIGSAQPDGQNTWSLDQDATIWSSSGDLQRLASEIETWPIGGFLGPLQDLTTLSSEQVKHMKAPPSAIAFTWCSSSPIEFAVGSEALVAEVAKGGQPEVAFILRGGFVFLNAQNMLCGICTIAPALPGSGMQFGSPLAWKQEWTAILEQRFSRITIQTLKDKGAHHYCWIRPEEPDLDAAGLSSPALKHGGFCYLFHEKVLVDFESAELRDCIFPLEQVFPTADFNVGQTFDFVDNMWEMFEKELKTPYFALTSAIEDLHNKSAISNKKFHMLMEAVEKVSSGRGAELQMSVGRNRTTAVRKTAIRTTRKTAMLAEDDTDELSPWLESVGCMIENDAPEVVDVIQDVQLHVIHQNVIQEEQLHEVDFDFLSTDQHKILWLMGALYQCSPFQLTHQFQIDLQILDRWLTAIKVHYKDNPYHNWNHAWDALQFCFLQLHYQNQDVNTLSRFNILVLFTAAIGHDVAHPGVSNQYLSRTGDSLAITYNDQSILENMHCATLFRTLERGDYDGADTSTCQDFLHALNHEQYMTFREKAIRAILATDMSQHFSFSQRLHVAAATSAKKGPTAGAKKQGSNSIKLRGNARSTQRAPSKEEKSDEGNGLDGDFVTCAMLKLADISNCLRPFYIYLRATQLLEREFFAQGDLERERGLPVSPMMNRSNDSLVDAQQGWANFIVAPFLSGMQSIIPAFSLRLQTSLQQNKSEMCAVAINLVLGADDDPDEVDETTGRALCDSASSNTARRSTIHGKRPTLANIVLDDPLDHHDRGFGKRPTLANIALDDPLDHHDRGIVKRKTLANIVSDNLLDDHDRGFGKRPTLANIVLDNKLEKTKSESSKKPKKKDFTKTQTKKKHKNEEKES